MNARGWVIVWARCADLNRRACTSKLVLADVVDAAASLAFAVSDGGRELRRQAVRHAHVAEQAHVRELQARERVELLALEDLAGYDTRGRW